jgi:orotate phosphoribosyltransferase
MARRSTLGLGVDTESTRRLLEIAREVGALLYGEFTLTSGKKSDHYFEGKRLTLSPEGAYLVGKVIFDQLTGAGVDAVGGVAIGGYPMVAAVTLVSHLEGKPVPSFIVREETKEHGTRRRIEGHLPEGSRVAIVDDVITTGGSVSRAIEAAEAAGCKVAKVIVLVDRHEGGSDKLKQQGYDFTAIIDLWPSEG